MSVFATLPLLARSITRRFVLLLAFAGGFLLVALTARLLTDAGGGHAELDRLFEFGGPTLASAFLLTGWLVGRFPLIATLVLMAGFFSDDRANGVARLYLARPVSALSVYGLRWVVLALVAFALSVVLLPLFDLILLGEWAGAGTLALIAADIAVYGGLVALLSLFTRADAWIALLLGMLAMTWHALRGGGYLDALTPGGRDFVSFVLPPHGALFAIEGAFGQLRPVPWEAFTYAVAWGGVLLAIAAVVLARREV